jgi:ferredoxin-NADP reductase
MALLTSMQARAWRAAATLTTPLVPADYLDMLAPLAAPPIPGRAPFRGRVEQVQAETAAAATLVIRTSRGWPGHNPGQYVRVGVDVAGVRRWRAYSITSGPRSDRRITITVRAMPGGAVSEHLVRRTGPGTILQLDAPTGDFILPRPLPAKILFITAGSGITPIAGILRHHLAQLPDVVLVHSSRTPDEAIFGPELRALPGLRLIERHTDVDGLLTPADITALVPDWAQRETWACGPLGLVTAAEDHWAAHGLTARLHTERFRPTFVAAGDGGTVTFARSGGTAAADGSTPLLDVGEASGVLMPSGCRMGICYGCVMPLSSGTVRDLRSGALTSAEPGDGVAVQTCISAAASDCVLDI